MIEELRPITRVMTGIDDETGMVSIEFASADDPMLFFALIEIAELDRLIRQLQETRAALGPVQ